MLFFINAAKEMSTSMNCKDKNTIFAHISTNNVITNGFKNVNRHYHYTDKLYRPYTYLIWGSRDL